MYIFSWHINSVRIIGWCFMLAVVTEIRITVSLFLSSFIRKPIFRQMHIHNLSQFQNYIFACCVLFHFVLIKQKKIYHNKNFFITVKIAVSCVRKFLRIELFCCIRLVSGGEIIALNCNRIVQLTVFWVVRQSSTC